MIAYACTVCTVMYVWSPGMLCMYMYAMLCIVYMYVYMLCIYVCMYVCDPYVCYRVTIAPAMICMYNMYV